MGLRPSYFGQNQVLREGGRSLYKNAEAEIVWVERAGDK